MKNDAISIESIKRDQSTFQKALRFSDTIQEENQIQSKTWRAEQKKKFNRKQNRIKTLQVIERLNELNAYAQQLQSPYLSQINQTFSFIRYQTASPLTVQSSQQNDTSNPSKLLREGKKQFKGECSFLGAYCPTEFTEHELVRKYIEKDDIVLELGGRFGTTSCEIANVQQNSGHLVVVEPDSAVWYLLSYNRHMHQCNFWIYRGVVSAEETASLTILPASYDSRTIPKSRIPSVNTSNRTNSISDSRNSLSLPSMNLQQLQEQVKLRFNVLLIDCEGCIEQLFPLPKLTDTLLTSNTIKNSKKHLQQLQRLKNDLTFVHTMIIEADMSITSPTCHSNCVDYRKWLYCFRVIGFQIVSSQQDKEFPDIMHYVLRKNSA